MVPFQGIPYVVHVIIWGVGAVNNLHESPWGRQHISWTAKS